MSEQKYSVLIAGCGELGSRHLQAVASLSEVAEVNIVDPRLEAIELGKARLKEIDDLNPDIRFNWFNELDISLKSADLCIVATRAQDRCKAIKEIAEKLGCKKFLLEKVVSQSVKEYEDLLSFCKNNRIAAWVNCKTRAYGIHKYIKQKLNKDEPFIFSRISGGHCLASNGIHGADLFVFYDEARSISLNSARIDPLLHESKRGKGLYDLSGTLYGISEKGSELILSSSGRHMSPDYIAIVSSSGRFFIDHFQQLALESYPDSGWKWNQIPFNENWNVSCMSKAFVSDILTKDRSDLPTIEECFPAHKFILGELQPYFDRLLERKVDFCPVT